VQKKAVRAIYLKEMCDSNAAICVGDEENWGGGPSVVYAILFNFHLKRVFRKDTHQKARETIFLTHKVSTPHKFFQIRF
jgi:hypothetical protein